ncbi:MAG: hypothetical protein JXR70_05125 [Spirochaetales bacterium]|nr:hypothetical protein [Spirochaetales bacterium]
MASFWQNIKVIIFKIFKWDPEAATKRKLLAQIYRSLKTISPPFYKAQGNEVLPGFAKAVFTLFQNLLFLNEILSRTLYHSDSYTAQKFWDFLIEVHLSEDDRVKKADFTYQNIKEKISASSSTHNTLGDIQKRFNDYINLFTTSEFTVVNEHLNEISRLDALCRYHYLSLLSHFDPALALNKTPSKTNFKSIHGEDIINDLLDLYFILGKFNINKGIEKNFILIIERAMPAKSQMLKEKVNKIIQRLDKLLNRYLSPDNLLNLMKLIKSNPYFTANTDSENKNFIEKLITRKSNQFTRDMDQAKRQNNEETILKDLSELFEQDSLVEVKGYSRQESSYFVNSGLPPLNLVKPMAVVKTFLLSKYKDEARQAIKKLLFESFYESKDFQKVFTESYHQSESLFLKLEEFENSLITEEKGSIAMVTKYIQDQINGKKINVDLSSLVDKINKSAAKTLEDQVNTFHGLAQSLKSILEDARNKNPKLISNIKTIGGNRNSELIGQILQIQKDLYALIKIMKNFTVIHNPVEEMRAPQG